MSNAMSYYYGTVDSTVRDILHSFHIKDWAGDNIVIASLDSQRDQTKILSVLKREKIDAHFLFEMSVVKSKDVSKMLRRELFTGFDELWFFDKTPNATVPRDLVSTSDAVRFEFGLPEIAEYVIKNRSCRLILADGCGLNYATPDSYLAQQIITG